MELRIQGQLPQYRVSNPSKKSQQRQQGPTTGGGGGGSGGGVVVKAANQSKTGKATTTTTTTTPEEFLRENIPPDANMSDKQSLVRQKRARLQRTHLPVLPDIQELSDYERFQIDQSKIDRNTMLRRPEFVGINLLKEIYMTASKLQHTQYQSRAWKCHQERFRNIVFEIFSHGLRWLTRKRSFWGLVEELTHSEVVNDIKKYSDSSEYKQWCMIWVLQVIDEGMLSCYLVSMNERLLSKFYGSDALLRDSHFFSNLMTVTQDLDRNTHEKKEQYKQTGDKHRYDHDESLPSMGGLSRSFGEEEPTLETDVFEQCEQQVKKTQPRDSVRFQVDSVSGGQPQHVGNDTRRSKSRDSLISRKSSSSSLSKNTGDASLEHKKKSKPIAKGSKSEIPVKKRERHINCFLPSSSLQPWEYDPLDAVCYVSTKKKPVRSLSTGAVAQKKTPSGLKRSNSYGSANLCRTASFGYGGIASSSSHRRSRSLDSSRCSSSDLSQDTQIAASVSGIKERFERKGLVRSPSMHSLNEGQSTVSASPPKEVTSEMSCSDTSTTTLTSEMVKSLRRQKVHSTPTHLSSSLSARRSLTSETEIAQQASPSSRKRSSIVKDSSSMTEIKEVATDTREESIPTEISKRNDTSTGPAFSSSSTSSSSSSLKAPIAAAAAVAVTLDAQGDCGVLSFRRMGMRSSSKNNRKSWPFYQNQQSNASQEGASCVSKLKLGQFPADRNLAMAEQRKHRSYSFDKNGAAGLINHYDDNAAAAPKMSTYSITSSGSFVSASSYSTESYESLFTSAESYASACDTSSEVDRVNCATPTESFSTLRYSNTEVASVNGSTSAESFATVNDSVTEHVSVNGSTSAESFATVDGSSADSLQGTRRFPPPLQSRPAPPLEPSVLSLSSSSSSRTSPISPPSPSPTLFPNSTSLHSPSLPPSPPPIASISSEIKTPRSVVISQTKTCTSSSTQCSPEDVPATNFLPSNTGPLISLDSLSINRNWNKEDTSPSHSNEVECGSDPVTPDGSFSDVTTPRHSFGESTIDRISLSSTSTSDGSQLAGECPFIFNCNMSRTVKLTLSSTCPACHCSLIAEFSPRMPRKCSYDGQYYCDRHHVDDMFYIPAEMVFNWKFEMFKVSRQNYEFLRSWYDQPVIDLNVLCARLHYYVTVLNNVRDQRQYLNYLHGILNECESTEAKNILSHWPCSYMYEKEDLYSMHDLVKVNSGEMCVFLDGCIAKSSRHIRKCEVCKLDAIVCNMCHAEPVLLTYDKNAAVCSRCGQLVHKPCLPISGVCTVCEIPRGTPEDINKHCVIA